MAGADSIRGGGKPLLALSFDLSWLPAAALCVWWLARLSLPAALPELSPAVQWLLALGIFLGFGFSVLVHEGAHAVTRLRQGTGLEPLRLYPFGSVPQRGPAGGGPEAEFLVAVSGPAVTLSLAFLFLLGAESLRDGSVGAVALARLAWLNALLGGLNLVPAFPLDAGRALRAVLWLLRGEFGWATTVSARLGSLSGLLLVAAGILVLLGDGSPVSGLLLLLLGVTIRSSATASYRHLLERRSLGGVSVRRFMDENPIAVQRALSVSALVEDLIYKHHLRMLPVVDGERLLGYVTAQRIRQVPREEWTRQSIGTIALPLSDEDTVAPESEALEALDKMTRTGLTRLMVVDGDRLAGTVSLQDLLRSLNGGSVAETDHA